MFILDMNSTGVTVERSVIRAVSLASNVSMAVLMLFYRERLSITIIIYIHICKLYIVVIKLLFAPVFMFLLHTLNLYKINILIIQNGFHRFDRTTNSIV